jgi:hypothetical protein
MGRHFTGVEKPCLECGTLFPVRLSLAERVKFCSPTCRTTHQLTHPRPRGSSVEKACEQCGTTFKVKQSAADHRRFCSIGCKTTNETANGRPAAQIDPIHFTCKCCGNDFSMKPSYLVAYRKKWGKDPMYCSIPCSSLGRKADAEQRAISSLTCIQCGGPMAEVRKPSGYLKRGRNLCSTECRALFRRLSYQAKHPDQEMVPRAYRNGYLRVIVPGKNGEPSREVFQHRYVMEQHIGRRLATEETVHHIDGNRANNDISNLELFSSRHGPGQRVIDKVAFAVEILRLYPEFAREVGVELHDVQRLAG